MSLINKFTDTNDWIVNAILEKILGRVPTKDELREGLLIKHDEQTRTSKIFWKGKLILLSSIYHATDEYGNQTIQGYFEVPLQFMDEYIEQRTKEWMK